MPPVDARETGSVKKEKRGFKSERYDRYQKMRKKSQGIVVKETKKTASKGPMVKEVRFDESDRRSFLLGFHKRKNERRVAAFTDAKQKIKRDNSKFRREQREEARKAYNAFAKVPILPDYSYSLPKDEVAAGEDDSGNVGSSDFFPSADALLDGVDGVSVSVAPLRSTQRTKLKNDFSDLPQAVAEELKRLSKAERGPSRTKPQQRTLKTLEKIRKIQRHSRKGHGKKSAKGKKRNR